MKWLLIIAVAAVLFALAWWQSGRARPGRGGGHAYDRPGNTEHMQADARGVGLGGPGGL